MSPSRPLPSFLVAGLIAVTSAAGRADDAPPRPTITVRAIRPDREMAAVLRLFDGSRASSPAAALSAWKRASVEPKRLGKVGDAVIALFNPPMVREFALLDDAELALSPTPDLSRWEWRARFPHDDGTLAAVAPTAALSGGRVDLPVGADTVVRFPGATQVLVARGQAGLVAASSREQLTAALAAPSGSDTSPIESGLLIRVDPATAGDWTSLGGRRWAEAARGTGCHFISGRVRLLRSTLLASWVGRFAGDTPIARPIDPDWLDAIPTRGPLAAFAARVDPRPESWSRLFDLVDRVERVDPERAKVAPARLRLALAAQVAGVRLEGDVLPHLLGVAGWVGVAGGKPDRALVALYLDDEAAARRLVAGVKGPRVADGPDEVIEVRAIGGRPLRLVRRRATVFLAWGDRAWAEAREALDKPERSSRPWLGTSRAGALPSRVGAIWPEQIPGVEPGSPLAAALAEAPPIRWAGDNEGNRTTDEVWADGLDATVRRFLDRLPLDPPPDP